MSIWQSFGYRSSLYSPHPVPGNELGAGILVGRDAEVQTLRDHWESFDTHASIEGSNGVGKTSLVSVASYMAMEDCKNGKSGFLILPLRDKIQLESGVDPEEQMLFSVANTLLEHKEYLASRGKRLQRGDVIEEWLGSPILRGRGAGISLAGFGGNLSLSKSSNSSGFSISSFRDIVSTWLDEIFKGSTPGAIVGVIDNMELLDTSALALSAIEQIRDTALSLPNVKWVLSGANGIMRGAVSSPRLHGRIADPISILPLAEEHVPDVVRRRMEAYALGREGEPPVNPEQFLFLYHTLGSNLRMALKFAEDYTSLIAREKRSGNPAPELEAWLRSTSDSYLESLTSITPRGWDLFDELLKRGGSCSPGEAEAMGFGSQQAMRPYVQQLEHAQLVSSSIDETDKRRRTIIFTPKAWLVNLNRNS